MSHFELSTFHYTMWFNSWYNSVYILVVLLRILKALKFLLFLSLVDSVPFVTYVVELFSISIVYWCLNNHLKDLLGCQFFGPNPSFSHYFQLKF